MSTDRLEILVTLDQKYLPPLRVMLASLYLNNPGTACRVHLLHRSLPESELQSLRQDLEGIGYSLSPVPVDGRLFEGAPVSEQYPQEMYYRLLAGHLLPPEIGRVLYLDPDLLVINPVRELWELDLGGRVFAAAAHTRKTELANSVNKLRLRTETRYFNSGVLLIDLHRAREAVDPEALFAYVKERASRLLLPDQDLLNALYGREIRELDDYRWNYDARNYSGYFLRSSGKATVDWVMQHTAILHFCGRTKPWTPLYRHRFGILYKHYQQIARRLFAGGRAADD